MAIIPIRIIVTPTWTDITDQVKLLGVIEEEVVNIYHDGVQLIEVLIDTVGDVVIDSSFDKQGTLILGSQTESFPFTQTTKFWVRRIKSELKPTSQIKISKQLFNANVGGSVAIHDALIQKYFTYNENGQLVEEIIIDTTNNTATVRKLTYNEDGTLNSCIITDFPLINCADSIGGADGTLWLLDNTLAIQCTLCKE